MKTYLLRHISYETDFYWKGIRYTQVIRHKRNNRVPIICRPARGQGEWIKMPPGRKIKPVFKYGDVFK